MSYHFFIEEGTEGGEWKGGERRKEGKEGGRKGQEGREGLKRRRIGGKREEGRGEEGRGEREA